MTAHFILYVEDQARSAAFYRRVLGREPRLDVPGMTEFDLAAGAVLGLMPEGGIRALLGAALPDPARARGVPRAELYLLVDDPAAHHARALSAGATELGAPARRDWGHVAAYALDPDGHVLAFAAACGAPAADDIALAAAEAAATDRTHQTGSRTMSYRIIYSSQATAALSLDELEAILVDARAGNEARGITGALVYVDGVFLQILEGDKEKVRALMHSIAGDARHCSVTVFHEAEVDQPLFSDWRMAYLSATPEQLAIWAGLEGTATIDDILATVRERPDRAALVAAGILEALAR